MHITSLDIESFGRFADFRRDGLDHGILVVHGPNEAGKSTLFHFFETMLYGFSPASRELHPYTAAGSTIEGTLGLRLSDGSAIRIARRLLSSPQGRILQDEGEHDLRNRPVSFVEHISREIFEAVYALDLDKLGAFDGAAQDEISDRLLGGLAADFLRPAREVVAELEAECQALWRPDRRGKPLVADLEKQVRALKADVREAGENDAAIRELTDRVHARDLSAETLKESLDRSRGALRRMERLGPVRRSVRELRKLEATSLGLDDYDALPADPGADLEDLDARQVEIDTRLSAMESERDRARETAAAFLPRHQNLLDHAEAVRAWSRKVEAHETRRATHERARADAQDAVSRLAESASAILSGPLTESRDALLALSLPDLREEMRAFSEADEALRHARTRLADLGLASRPPMPRWPGPVLIGVGLLLAGIAGFVGATTGLFVGLGLAVLGAVAFFLTRAVSAPSPGLPTLDLDALSADRDRRASAVAARLAGIDLPVARVERPDGSLTADLEKLLTAIRQAARAQEQLAELLEILESERTEVAELARACALEGKDLVQQVDRLEEALSEAETRAAEAEGARNLLADLLAEAEELDEEREEIARRADALREPLLRLGDGDADAGLSRLGEMRSARARHEALTRSLDTSTPDWRDLASEISVPEDRQTPDVEFDDTEAERLRREIRELEEALSAEVAEVARTREEIRHRESRRTRDAIESELAQLESRILDAHRTRDRLALLASVIRAADRRFRDAHQPDVVRRASEYIGTITGGRYDRLLVDEATGGLQVRRPDSAYPAPVEAPLSRGTLDQIHFALRIALVDHLDEGREPLPLFLDEVFVNWDDPRRSHGLALLRRIAEHRQVVFFTCHPGFASELSEAGAQIVHLAR